MAIATAGAVAPLDMNNFDIGILTQGEIVAATPTLFSIDYDGEVTSFIGAGFVYSALGTPSAGVVTGIADLFLGQNVYSISGLDIPVTSFVTWAFSGDNAAARLAVFGGADQITGNVFGDHLLGYSGDDLINGGDGADTLEGGAGLDTVFGGTGNDVIIDAGGANYLRGDDGNDSITGGADFDDINGNIGNDTGHGGLGADWVVGGKDQDLLYGDDGDDIVYGNLGDDSCDGGAGSDLIRGGQGNDVLTGGDGADWMSGDRGNDTMSGGAGADTFHTFAGAGIDRVTDFNAAEGDKVQVDAGTTYSVSQVGADTIVDMGNGDQMVLAGVQLNSLPTGWIFTL